MYCTTPLSPYQLTSVSRAPGSLYCTGLKLQHRLHLIHTYAWCMSLHKVAVHTHNTRHCVYFQLQTASASLLTRFLISIREKTNYVFVLD